MIFSYAYPSFRFHSWIESPSFKSICHILGDVTYYLGHSFVASHKPTSKGLSAVEEYPVEKGNFGLPVRYPGDLSWEEEIRLLFPVFLRVNPRTYFGTGPDRVVIPYITLIQASKKKPMLFASMILQRSFDRLMKWPNVGDALDRDYLNNWKVCNMIKFPPIRQTYPISKRKLAVLRSRVSAHYVPDDHVDGAMHDMLPDDFTPEERDALLTCNRIDEQFQADLLQFHRHIL